MHKTTVYLNDEEVQALRQLGAATGRSQSELIREAIREVVARAPQRQFRSLGKGEGPGGAAPRWDPTDLYTRRHSDCGPNAGADADDNRR